MVMYTTTRCLAHRVAVGASIVVGPACSYLRRFSTSTPKVRIVGSESRHLLGRITDEPFAVSCSTVHRATITASGCRRMYNPVSHSRACTTLSTQQVSASPEKAWVCDWPGCGRRFRYRSRLAEHSKIHTRERQYVCTWEGCDKRFVTRGNLNRHTATHTTRASFMCQKDGCGKLFKTHATLTAHMKLHREANLFVCSWDGCGRVFTTAARLATHETQHKNSEKYVCRYPGCTHSSKFRSEAELAEHMRKHLGVNTEGVASTRDTKQGKKLVSGGDTFKIYASPRVGELGVRSASADSSESTERNIREVSPRSEDSGVNGSDMRARVEGSTSPSESRNIDRNGEPESDEIDGSDKNTATMNRSISDTKGTAVSDEHTPSFTLRWLDLYACEWPGCDAAFDKKHLLKAHRATHTPHSAEERPFHCHWPGCRLAFAHQATLTKHLKTHVQAKDYRCDHAGCGATFTNAGGLVKHLRTHTGEKPYVCPWEGCGKAFAQSQNLTAHLRQHTGEVPFVCHFPGCSRRFKSVQALKYHRTTHTR